MAATSLISFFPNRRSARSNPEKYGFDPASRCVGRVPLMGELRGNDDWLGHGLGPARIVTNGAQVDDGDARDPSAADRGTGSPTLGLFSCVVGGTRGETRRGCPLSFKVRRQKSEGRFTLHAHGFGGFGRPSSPESADPRSESCCS